MKAFLKKYNNLSDVLNQYRSAMDGIESVFEVKGKTVEKANAENATLQLYYDQKKVELYALMKRMESDINRIRGEKYKTYKERYSRDLTDREINRYIDTETDFLTVNEIFIEVQELYQKFNSIVESFTARGYALNNITKARIAEVHDITIT